MLMPPRLRKLGLLAHIVASVGWLGAVLASLVLGVRGLTATDEQVAAASYLALETLGSTVLFPLSVASLVTGLVQALGTRWGLLRHYWVIAKLLMNLFATAILWLYLQTLDAVAAAARASLSGDAVMRDPSPVVHGAGALVLLLVAAGLSVYKPPGQTGYGERRERRTGPAAVR